MVHLLHRLYGVDAPATNQLRQSTEGTQLYLFYCTVNRFTCLSYNLHEALLFTRVSVTKLTSRTALHCSVEFVRCEQLHWKACVQNTISRAHSSNFSSEPVVKVWNSLPPRTGELFFSDNI